jgi:hypothetical protein
MGVLWSSFEWMDDIDLCSAGGCMMEALLLLFSFPSLIDNLNCMWGKSSLGVSVTFFLGGIFLILGHFPLLTMVWIGFIELLGSEETLISSIASP